ncbi:hypothetical protein KGQ55_00885 [Patescibacteria group bacterium]|nr:hypothetical protein [Patescibacteria group bacterium]
MELPFLHALESWAEGTRKAYGFTFSAFVLIPAYVLAVFVMYLFAPDVIVSGFRLTLFFAPLWMPYIVWRFSWIRWIQYRQAMFMAHDLQKPVLLELRLPRDTRKSPLAMEAVLAGIHFAPGINTWYKRYWLGRVKPWWSFEIVSVEGKLHFYIWVWDRIRRQVESSFYAQYPGIQLVEVPDYTLGVAVTDPVQDIWGCEYQHTKPDPYPIKSYVDYGLDQPRLKAEEQIDPMAQVLEFLGSLGPGEQVWLHFVIQMTKGDKYKGKKNKKGGKYTWKDEGHEIVQQIREEVTSEVEYVDPVTKVVRKSRGFPNPTKGQVDIMAAIERNIGKVAFDIGIRCLYITAPGKHKSAMHGMLTSTMFRPFSSEQFNGLEAAGRWSEEFYDYPWEDPGFFRTRRKMTELLEAARRRSYFNEPFKMPWMTMSVEEIATLFHIPSSAVATPSLSRIQSTTTSAPSNLPT